MGGKRRRLSPVFLSVTRRRRLYAVGEAAEVTREIRAAGKKAMTNIYILIFSVLFILMSGGAPAQTPFQGTGGDKIRVTGEMRAAEQATSRIVIAFQIPDGQYIYERQLLIRSMEVTLKPVEIPEAKQASDRFQNKTVGIYDHDVKFVYAVVNPPASFTVKVRYQGCSRNLCFMPQTRTLSFNRDQSALPEGSGLPPDDSSFPFADGDTAWKQLAKSFTVTGRVAGYLPEDIFLQFLDQAESGKPPPRNRLSNILEKQGVWITIVLILAGGLALNLTPCVLPMIPVNIAIIGAGARAESRGRGFALGVTYGAGIAVVYGMLGLVVVLSGGTFGTLNSLPWFNLVIAALFIGMALAMFDVFHIDFSRLHAKISPDKISKGKFVTAFVLGSVAALLASACVAPVVISVLLLSADLYSRDVGAGLMLPFLLGVGMALPWPFAGAGLSFLPKPGKWMERIKYAFGVIILLIAFWYGGMGIKMLMNRVGADHEVVIAAKQERIEKEGWYDSLGTGLAKANREGKPVFVDFRASWCKNCLKMKKTTFRKSAVRERLDAYVKIKYQAEDLTDPEIKSVLEYFEVLGLPTYIVLQPSEG